ncbi:MAG: ATP-binding protein, partial [Nitriliruptoraceae bacterium]
PVSPARVVVGTVLVAVAVAGFLAAHDAFRALWDLGLALVAAMAGIALLFGPWLFRLTQQLTSERRERIRQEERAEVAAHLHDSVLQTLALIQRAADDPQRTATLARRQERELRGWLYGSRARDEGTLSGAVQQVADEVESDHTIVVEVVVVGDASLDDDVRALVAAVREACINAARHSGAPNVDVYVEATDSGLTAFVRDRGRGFNPARVGHDRQGIRQSIVARMERHGGEARVESSPSGGTEVELRLPLTPTEES